MFQHLRALFAAKPLVEFKHAELGILTLDSGLWSGQIEREGRSIGFCIAGTDLQPDAGLIERVREVGDRLSEVERIALDFLHTHDQGVRDGEFTLYSIDFLREDKPHLYTLEFNLAGDEDGIWRVEYENGQPQYVGRDD